MKWNMVIAVVVLLSSISTYAQAQQTASQAASRSAVAGATLGSPFAFGPAQGVVGFGLGGITLHGMNANKEVDGFFGIATGLGDANKYVGVGVSVATASLYHKGRNDDHFGDTGLLGAKVFRYLPNNFAVAIGTVGTPLWGNDRFKDQNETSVYAVGTKVFSVANHALAVNLGLGNKQFVDPDDNGNTDGVGVFGGLAFYVTPGLSLIADYTGRFTNLGISVAPFIHVPLTVTVGAFNVGQRHGIDTQLMGSIGYAIAF